MAKRNCTRREKAEEIDGFLNRWEYIDTRAEEAVADYVETILRGWTPTRATRKNTAKKARR